MMTCPKHGSKPGDPVEPDEPCTMSSLACPVVEGDLFGKPPDTNPWPRCETFRDPTVRSEEVWRVRWFGYICRPRFDSKGAAEAYMDGLKLGRKAEI